MISIGLDKTSETDEFDIRQYGERVQVASRAENLSRQDEEEWVVPCDAYGITCGPATEIGRAHHYGIIHKTADVFLMLPDGRLLIQHRSGGDHSFPNRYGPSAGGHVGIDELPLQTAVRESVEELAVNILADRLVALHDNLRGWPLYYYSLTYEGSEGTVVINQNRPRGEFVVLDREKVLSNKTRETALKRLNLALPWLPPATIHPRLELKRIFFNQERTFYYVVPVSEAQASSVVYQSSEVMGVVSMTLHEFAALAEDPEYRTDTLSCLLRHNAFAKLQRLLSEL